MGRLQILGVNQPNSHLFSNEIQMLPSQPWKMIGMLKKVKLRGIAKVGWLFTSSELLTTFADYET